MDRFPVKIQQGQALREMNTKTHRNFTQIFHSLKSAHNPLNIVELRGITVG
jgi:hypothetical protein